MDSQIIAWIVLIICLMEMKTEKKYKQRELNYIIKKHDFFMRIKLR